MCVHPVFDAGRTCLYFVQEKRALDYTATTQRKTTMTLARLTLLAALLAFCAPAFAQQPALNSGDPSLPASASCAFSFFSGTPTTTFTRYCLSANGNIVQLDSPSGNEMIATGGPLEGYGLCDFTPNVHYYDYASVDSGNWGSTTVTTPNATTKVFVRTTLDGLFQLTQTITQLKGSASTAGSIKITMAVKNLSGIAKNNLTLLRFANVDAGATPTNNEFVSSANSSFGQEPGQRWGLGLTTNTFTFANQGLVWDFNVLPTGPDPCFYVPHVVVTSFTGDGSIGHVYNISIPKGGTKTVTMTYKPI